MGASAGAASLGRSLWLRVWIFGAILLLPSLGWAQLAGPYYHVVALRVEFQADTTRYTTGEGTFADSLFAEGLVPTIDPLPHDAAYFMAHLAFLEDYVKRVSDGRMEVWTHLLPEVVQLGQKMEAYSPVGLEADGDAERRKLAAMIEEAWSEASRSSRFDIRILDPARTAFIIFHAGVGRDVELLGTILDKTPLDLPSIFISAPELARLGADAITFKGIPVGGTSILPRTESRQGHNPLTDEAVLLELSINGLLAASFLNHLGVPDLFNTETGESAIGPYGLMDPAGIFAYAGMLPPEPSAWTRQLLGWLDTDVVRGKKEQVVELAAAGLPGSNAVRVEISEYEYFLVENRHRDPEGDGLVLQVWQQGTVVEQRFFGVADDFSPFSVDAFVGGVVVGADNYDFALPGRDAEDRQFEGGILVWHVDERRVVDGQFNSDPGNRAIDLEEADSAQELGTDGYFGSPYDFFFEGNDTQVLLPSGAAIRLYKNRFASNTTPSSLTNAGGHSFIVLEQFSAPGPVMTFTYRQEGAHGIEERDLHVLEGARFGEGSAILELPNVTYAHAATAGLLYVLAGEGPTSVVSAVTKPVPTAAGFVVLQEESGAFALREYQVDNGVPVPSRALAVPAPGLVPKGPLLQVGGAVHVLLGGADRSVVASLDGSLTTRQIDGVGEGIGLAGDREALVVGRRGVRVVDGALAWDYELVAAETVGHPAFGRDRRGLWGVLSLPDRQQLLVLEAGGRVWEQDVGRYASADQVLSRYPVLADLDQDGLLEIVVTAGDVVYAFHDTGALADGYPIHIGTPVRAQPLVVELSGSDARAIVLAGMNGELYAFERGQLMPGFPLHVGGAIDATPWLGDGRLTIVSRSGRLRAYAWQAIVSAPWGELYGTSTNSSVAITADRPAAAGPDLIVDAETYNWPNPIRNGQSFLRCTTREDADVRVSITDAAGMLVDELAFVARAQRPVEMPWQTNAASGLYYARITATAASGRSGTKLVKMAVIR